jgi:hypothetical protein
MSINAPTVCSQCNDWTLEMTPVERSLEVGGHVFDTILPGRRCSRCGHVRCAPAPLARFRLLVACELLESGERSGAVLRFAREASGLSRAELAALLDLTPDQLERWEQRDVVYRGALEVVAARVRARLAGRPAAPELGILGPPRPLAARVEVDLFSAAVTAR